MIEEFEDEEKEEMTTEEISKEKFQYFNNKIPIDESDHNEIIKEWDLLTVTDQGKVQMNHSNIAWWIKSDITYISVPADSGAMWIYYPKRGYWLMNGESYIAKFLQEMFDENMSKYHYREILGHLKRSSYIERASPDPQYINVRNGVIDLGNWNSDDDDVLIDNSPFEYFKTCIPWEYRENAEPDKVLDFLSDLVREDDCFNLL